MNDFEDVSWGMFAATGNIGYYLLLGRLREDKEREQRENRH